MIIITFLKSSEKSGFSFTTPVVSVHIVPSQLVATIRTSSGGIRNQHQLHSVECVGGNAHIVRLNSVHLQINVLVQYIGFSDSNVTRHTASSFPSTVCSTYKR